MVHRQIIEETTVRTVEKVLSDLGLVPEIITYSEVRKLYGRTIANTARESEDIEWFPMHPKGKGMAVYCKRSEFTNFLYSRKSYQ